MPTTLIDQVRITIKKYNMLEKHDRILVGLSGGPDSIVLLHILSQLRKEYMLDIYIAHLDHKFRGEQSTSDRKFCEDIAGKSGFDIVCEEIDVPKIIKKEKISPEEAARQARYDFFERVARKKNITKIAVGHTRDDQAETVLMRLIRGSGMLGLGGVAPVKDIHGITVIRPVIEISRSRIDSFIKEFGLEFRHDSSNDDVSFTRNRIRHELFPYLEGKFNPNIKEVLANMAENLRVENEFLEKFARRKFKGMVRKNKSGAIEIDIKKFRKQPEAMRKRIFRSSLEALKGNLRRFTYQHWKEVKDLIESRPGNSIVDLPGDINIVKRKESLLIEKRTGT